jgi:hypoxanthine phosphoribosyltransferase
MQGANMKHANDQLAEVLLTAEDIQQRVQELGREIAADYADKQPVLVGVLRGAIVFMVDLIRAIDAPLAVDFMAVSSYGASTRSSGVVRILKDLDTVIEGRHVLIVEDIIDTGLTLQYITELLWARHPASLRIVTLLDKPENRKVRITVDYVGFTIPNRFVVGYGLDFNEIYRNLPYVGVLKPTAYGGPEI